ncbi:hypothetical protein [Polaribacter sp. Hel1_85]|uniref:hypothetical protein n=1 Tax=Polaribacter sp. Hel1_85 TaxID=1250005 RepID=UPI00052B68FF|nr:hypothetical protein [Polaribacter sp. Hel1_85]KGL64038.1 hypothetical protein PHEL85_1080 [Polaribacter sp. Hel1_85]
MKHKLYKPIVTLIAICFLGTVFAQKFDEKFTENFKVNKDVEVAINASNTEINVTTWNKNEVQVEAFIEIEGLSKKEAEKYFKNWNFEALGNKSKVKINSQGNSFLGSRNNFIIHDNIDFNFPDIQMPDFDSIIIPEMNFDFDMDFDFDFDFDFNLDNIEEEMKKDGDYSFEWNDGEDKIRIKSKKEWDAFKKTKKYRELKEKLSFDKQKMKEKLVKSKLKMKEGLEKARIQYKKIDKEKIRKELAKAKEKIMEMKLNFHSDSDDITINGKKIKIKKRLEIKVPKKATFNLNTRHCKVKLPNTVASGNVKYGGFNAGFLNGGKLTIDYSKVSIADLNGCTLFLNNVTDAKIASVTNTKMSNNSSGVKIALINENVNLSNKFGELTVEKFNPRFGEFILNLSHSDAKLILGNTNSAFKYKVNSVKLDNKRAAFLNKNNSENNIIKVNGDYSQIIIQ